MHCVYVLFRHFQPVFPLRCANAQYHQNCCAVKSHIRTLATFKIWCRMYSISHSPCKARVASLAVCLHSCTIACALKQIFAQCDIFLEGKLLLTIKKTCSSVQKRNLLVIVNSIWRVLLDRERRTAMSCLLGSIFLPSAHHALPICFGCAKSSSNWLRLPNAALQWRNKEKIVTSNGFIYGFCSCSATTRVHIGRH